jgi:hypothetical protein
MHTKPSMNTNCRTTDMIDPDDYDAWPIQNVKATCPWCSARLKFAMAMPGERARDAPDDGAVNLCKQCGEWSVFTADSSLRKPTDTEFAEITSHAECQMLRRTWLIQR